MAPALEDKICGASARPQEKDSRVLVIDDDKGFRPLISRILKSGGYRALEAADGKRGIALARGEKPGVIILDWVLGRPISGEQTLKDLKAGSETASIPVIVISSIVSTPQDHLLIKSLGADEFVTKSEINDSHEAFLRRIRVALMAIEKDSPLGDASSRKRRGRALVVEDDPDYQNLLRGVIQNAGLDFLHVDTLRKAREILRTITPEFILLDESLPDGSGQDLCREVRNEHRLANVPLAFLTAKRTLCDGEAWYDAGADACWPKCKGALRLSALIKGLLRRKAWDTRMVKPNVAGLMLDAKTRIATYCDEDSQPLSSRELLFLDMLANASPDVLPREEICGKLFDFRADGQVDLALNEMVRRLKRKLPKALSDGILAVYRRGYRLKK